MSLKSIQKLGTLVEEALRDYPSTRDCDITLYKWLRCKKPFDKYTHDEYGLPITVGTFLDHIKAGRLPSFESVGRARRKLQEENPELRGEKWYARHKEANKVAEAVVTGDLFTDNSIYGKTY